MQQPPPAPPSPPPQRHRLGALSIPPSSHLPPAYLPQSPLNAVPTPRYPQPTSDPSLASARAPVLPPWTPPANVVSSTSQAKKKSLMKGLMKAFPKMGNFFKSKGGTLPSDGSGTESTAGLAVAPSTPSPTENLPLKETAVEEVNRSE